MSLPTSLGAYLDCRQLFDAALADPKGARACLGTWEACRNMQSRMNYFRSLDRIANKEIYPKGDPKWGISAYDPYVVQLMEDADGEWWVYVQPRDKILVIEGLSEVEPLIEVEGTEVHLIEDQSGQ